MFCALPFLSACCSMSPKVWVEDEQVLSVDGEGVATLACATHNGAIRAEAAETSTYEVTVARRAGGQTEEDAQACLDAIEVTQIKSGDRLSLGWRWAPHRKSGWGAKVSFEIQQPAQTPLVASTHNGPITVVGLQGGVHLTTHNGSIEIDGCRGSTRAFTYNGRIRGEIDSREVSIETHNGGVELQLLGDGPVAGSVRTHNGGVVLRVGDNLSTRLVCSTHNGAILVQRELDVVVHKNNVLVADLGAGGDDLGVETHNGAIILR